MGVEASFGGDADFSIGSCSPVSSNMKFKMIAAETTAVPNNASIKGFVTFWLPFITWVTLSVLPVYIILALIVTACWVEVSIAIIKAIRRKGD